MREKSQPRRTRQGGREKLLDASFTLIREKGYSATSVDELCAQAGVTKGAFFHHFPSKDALALAALDRWDESSRIRFQEAAYHKHEDPLDRVLGYLAFRKSLLKEGVRQSSCLAGTMVQEAYETHTAIRDACDVCISNHAATLELDIAEAMKLYGVRGEWSAQSLAFHFQAVLQGAFILAKAKAGSEIAEACVDHLRRYAELLFRAGAGGKRQVTGPQSASLNPRRRRQHSQAASRGHVKGGRES